jgi:Protein of unknown function (DUF2442)/Domain of unknown function (DUF4160)
MPTVLRWGPYRAFFCSNERGEPPHIRVRSGDFEAKFWLHDLSVAVNAGFPAHEIGAIIRHLRSQREVLEGNGVSTLEIDVGDIRAVSVAFTADELVVTLADGRRIATPLAWYPRLRNASAAARGRFELMPMGVHWPELDEDLGIAGMLQGRPAA